jgi:hypothetical protein
VKKILAILVLVVFLFNTGGYYIFFWGLHYTASARLSDKLDKGNYSGDETYEFKIPFSIPYPIYDNGFDRAHGELEFGGEFYTLVKQKLANDTLYIVCIKNHKKEQLAKAFAEYADASNDTGKSANKAGNELLSKLIKDFNGTSMPGVIHGEGWSRNLCFSGRILATIEMADDILSPPPNPIV